MQAQQLPRRIGSAASETSGLSDCSLFTAAGSQMLPEKFQGPRPGLAIGFGPVAGRPLFVKAMGRIGIEEELMLLPQSTQLSVHPAHLIRRGILVKLAEVSLDRAGDVRRNLRRRGAIPPL